MKLSFCVIPTRVIKLCIAIYEKIFGRPDALPVVGTSDHGIDVVEHGIGLPAVVSTGNKSIGVTGGYG